MLYTVVFKFLYFIGYSTSIDIITDYGKIYYESSLVIDCQITESGNIGSVGWQNSKDNKTFSDKLLVFGGSCSIGINAVNGVVKCNTTQRKYSAEIPIGNDVESGKWWRCTAAVNKAAQKSISAQVLTIVHVQSVSLNKPPSLTLKERQTIDVECQSIGASRPRTEIKWYIIGKGEIMSGIGKPIYTTDSMNETLTTTQRQITYIGNRTDNGNSLYCEGHQLLTSVNSSTVLNIEYEPSTSLVLTMNPNGILTAGSSVNITCAILGGNPLANLTLICNGMNGLNFNTSTTAISVLIFTVNASNNGNQCECTATHHVNNFRRTQMKKIEVQYAPFQPPIITQLQPQTDYVPVNTSITLSCDVSGGNPLAVLSLDCDRNIAAINNTSSDKASYSLTFQVNKQDNGRRCTCSATHPDPIYRPSVQFAIVVYYPPETNITITQDPSRPVDAGKKVTLTCNVTGGNPLANLSWDCGSLSINNTSGNTSSNSVQFQVNKTDNGRTCICFATHPLQSYRPTKQIILTVYYEPSPPSLMMNPDLPLFEGNETQLTCSVDDDGNPQANITLIWNEIKKHAFSPNKWTIGPMQKRYDGAVVSCRAENEYSNRENIYLQVNESLNVEYYPVVLLEDKLITYVEGETVQVKCSVYGNPIPRAQWVRDGVNHTMIKRGSELNMTIFNVTRQQAGRYYCKANSTSKRYGDLRSSMEVNLVIHYPPDVRIDYIFNNESERQVTFICNATGNPNKYTYIGWKQTYYGIDIRNSTQLTSLTQDNNRKLILSSISYQDSGNYTCFVHNGVPDRHDILQQTSKEQLNIEGFPKLFDKLPADDTYSTRRGGNVTVSLKFFTFPNITEAFWHRNSSNSPINTKAEDRITGSISRTSIETTFHDVKVNISNYAYHALLNITTLDEEMEGAYTLVLKNGFKDKNFTIFVVISSKPDDPTDFNVTKTTSTRMTFSWNRGYSGGHNQCFVVIVFDSTGLLFTQTVPDNYTMTAQTWTISELNPSTKYVLHLYSTNVIGNSSVIKINATTDSSANVSGPNTKEFPIGAVVGILTGAIFAVLVIIGIIYTKRRCSIFKKDPESTGRKKLTTINKEAEEDDGLKDNILYESAGQGYIPKQGHSGDEYSVVLKNKEKFKLNIDSNIQETALYAEVVNKSKTKQKGNICTNDIRSKGLKKKEKIMKYECREDVYENMSGKEETETGFYPEKDKRNKDGLVYADLVFNPSPNGPKFVHGIDDRTIYADVDTTQKIDPLPSSDDEETIENKAIE